MYYRHRGDGSTTVPNALHGMYLLITALHGKWSRSDWLPPSKVKKNLKDQTKEGSWWFNLSVSLWRHDEGHGMMPSMTQQLR